MQKTLFFLVIKPFFLKLKPFKKNFFFENQELTACKWNNLEMFGGQSPE